MIVSNNTNRPNKRRLQVCALLFALVVLPLGVGCQEGGDLTSAAEQSVIEADLLRAEAEAVALQCDEVAMRRVRGRLGAAVEAGVMSREDAGRRFRAFAESCKARGDSRNAECTDMGRRLRELIAAGEISEEDARARYRASGCVVNTDRRADACKVRVRTRIGRAVEAGTISRDEARALYDAAVAEHCSAPAEGESR